MTQRELRDHLFETSVQGILYVLNLPDTQGTRRVARRVCRRLFGNIIEAAVVFDQMIRSESLQAASRWLCEMCGQPQSVAGLENIPPNGPVILASNHPGYYETMVITSLLPRDDLKVVVGGVPYFTEMPNTSQFILYTDMSAKSRVRVLREAVSHLRQGGILLIYPTGQTDPDPDWLSGARQRIRDWSPSLGVMLRRAPASLFLPVVISGILNPKFFNHPVARVQPNQRYRQRVAELFQMLQQFNRPGIGPLSSPRIRFGQPASLGMLMAESPDNDVMMAVQARAKDLLDLHIANRQG
jgi:hypothetical protein